VSNKGQKTYPGGKGLGLNVLYESQTLDVDLLGGENCLAFESRLDDADFEANESLSVVAPGRSRFRGTCLRLLFWFLGRAIQAASRVDREVKMVVEEFPAGSAGCFGLVPGGPIMVLTRGIKGRLKYRGGSSSNSTVTYYLTIKAFDKAMRLLSFREGIADAVSEKELVVSGDMRCVYGFIRILDRLTVLLLPKMLAKRTVKRDPEKHILRKHISRILVYLGILLGI